MLSFLKYLIQLVLSPTHGWEDISRENPDPKELTARGLYPLMGIAAITEFLAFAYERNISIDKVLVRAVADFGAYFIGFFIAKLVFDIYLKNLTSSEPDKSNVATFSTMAIGLMVFIQIISNCLPWKSLVFVKLLPLYTILVIFHAAPYLKIRKNREMNFVGIATGATVAVPLVLYYFLYFILP